MLCKKLHIYLSRCISYNYKIQRLKMQNINFLKTLKAIPYTRFLCNRYWH